MDRNRLAALAEEAGGVVQTVGKVLQHGYEGNRQELTQGLDGLQAASQAVREDLDNDEEPVETPEEEPTPEPAPTGKQKVALTANRITGTAPCGIAFSVDADGFGVRDHYHDLRYHFNFGDPGHYTRHDVDDMIWDRVFDADGTRKIVRGREVWDETGYKRLEVLTQIPATPSGKKAAFLGNDSNIAYGPRVVHVFEKPGTYTVAVDVLSQEMVERGERPIRQTLEVKVVAKEDTVPAERFVYITGNAKPGAEPKGALTFKSYVEALDAVRNTTTPIAFLFRRGQKHSVDNAGIKWGNNRPQFAMAGAYGPVEDGDPTLDRPPSLGVEKVEGTQVIYTGLKLAGPYDSTDPYSISSWPEKGIKVDSKWGGYTTIWDCDLSGYDMCIEGSKDVRNFVIGNCSIRSWMNFGIYIGGGLKDCGLCGVWAKQPIGTVTGARKSDKEAPFIADHGPFRCGGPDGALSFNLCDLRSLNSWSGWFQPSIRVGGNGDTEWPEKSEVVFDRIRAEIGGCIGAGVYQGAAKPKRTVYDKIYEVVPNSLGNSGVLGFSCPGITVRNVTAVILDQPKGTGQRPSLWVNHLDDPYDDSVKDYGLDIYSSTFVDLRTDETGPDKMGVDFEGFELFGHFNFDNNITARPKRKNPDLPNGPLDESVLWSVTYDGLRFEDKPFDPAYAANPSSADIFVPTKEAKATDGRIAIDDMFGNIRDPKRPTKGAVARF